MRRLPPLSELKAFEAAARHLSFASAATELNVTATAISHHIRQLERRLGFPLFRRRPRPLALTSEGARLYPVLRQGFDSFADAIRTISPQAARAQLRLSTTTAFASRWLVPRLSDLSIAVESDVSVDATERVVDLVAGEADAAVRYGGVIGTNSRHLVSDEYVPVGCPRLIGSARLPVDAAELADLPLISFKWKSEHAASAPKWKHFLELIEEKRPTRTQPLAAKELVLSEEVHAIEAALAGQGLALVSRFLVSRELSKGWLLQVHPQTLPGPAYSLRFAPTLGPGMSDRLERWFRQQLQENGS